MAAHKRYSKARRERRLAETFINDKLGELFKGWDRIRETENCPHCHGTGKAPGNGETECGFCR